MKTLLTAAFIFISSILLAQKKYDCVVISKNYYGEDSTRFVGSLKFVSDSSIVIFSKEQIIEFNWKQLKAVNFRKHDGFTRTALPIAVSSGVLGASIVIASNTGMGKLFAIIFAPIIAKSITFYSLFIITPTYFIFRNKAFYINTYDAFLNFKQSSAKYILK